MGSDADLGRKVVTQHRLIDSLLGGLRKALEAGDTARAKQRLSSLHHALDAHFTLEENHYFPVARSSRPELETDLDRLVEEHGRFLGVLAGIDGQIGSMSWDAALEALAELDVNLHEHEDVEHRMLGG